MLAALVVASLVALTRAASYKPGVVVECIQSAEDRERLKALTIQALDEALKNQLQHLFMTWMRDSHGQPGRAQAGASQAITAWLGARKSVGTFSQPGCPD